MPVTIEAVISNSPAAKKKLAPGDVLLSINGHAINDVLDYRFYAAERKLKLILQRNGNICSKRLRKEEYEDLGLEFRDGLMDKQRRCKNNCVFCFIDQLPEGLRESLYFKDDDARLSFLFGNYITLTNLSGHDVRRIIDMRLSPINVSIHTMNPALRGQMMGNPGAGECLKYLNAFAEAGLDINAQLVLCPGWNDGGELQFSLQELMRLPTLRSVAAVPVGLTKFREKLTPLRPFTPEEAGAVIDQFAIRNSQFAIRNVELCCSDEFFILAGRDMPGVEYYGEFRQIENGVGLWASFKDEMLAALQNSQRPTLNSQFTIATGEAAFPLMKFLVDEIQKMWHNKRMKVCCVRNDFFGPHITVAGLLTGRDIIAQLRGQDLGQALLLPAVMFNQDGLTLDDMILEDISKSLGIPVKAVKNDAEELLKSMLGEQ